MNRPAAALLGSLLLLTACHKAKPTVAVAPPAPPPPPADATVKAPRHDSGAGLVYAEIAGRRSAIVADETDEAVRVIDLESQKVTTTTFLPGGPGQMVLAENGTLYVAVRGAAKVLALRFGADGKTREIAAHNTSDEPYGLAMTPDQKSVVVSTISNPRLELLSASDLTSVFGTVLPRNPRSVVVSKDGTRAFVSHATGSIMSVVALGPETPGATHTVSLAMEEKGIGGFSSDSMSMTPMKPVAPSKLGMSTLELDDGNFGNAPPRVRPSKMAGLEPPTPRLQRSAIQGFAMSRIGDQLIVPTSMVMTSDGSESQFADGYGSFSDSTTLGSNVPFVSQVDEAKETPKSTKFSGFTDRRCFEQPKKECILPRAMADDGKRVFVACLDSDEVMVVDPAAENEHFPACKKTITERPRLKVASPSAVALTDRGEVLAWSSFTHSLSVLGAPEAKTVATNVEVPRLNSIDEQVAAGQRLFHESGNAKISSDGRACASCHVDGRDDGLVWPTPTGKRQTPMLAGRLRETGPYGWNGEHATLAVHIKQTVKNLGGTGVEKKDLDALAAYCTSMHAPTPPTTKALAERGRAVFHSPYTSCASCHQDDRRFTDGETHKLQPKTEGKAFDTPSLAFVGQTAPYFHDGRFATLDALVEGAEDANMGRTKQLSPDDKRALVAYLESL